jgi:hypothetical protein
VFVLIEWMNKEVEELDSSSACVRYCRLSSMMTQVDDGWMDECRWR